MNNKRKNAIGVGVWVCIFLCTVAGAIYLAGKISKAKTVPTTSHEAYSLSYHYNNEENYKLGESVEIDVESSRVLLVNKAHTLPPDYVPKNMVAPDIPFMAGMGEEKRLMEPTSAAALEKLFAAAKKDGINLMGISAYRSYATQNGIYHANLANKGYAFASVFSAQAGRSEHQTGMAIDVSAASVGFVLSARFAYSEEGKWLTEHCTDYGFIIRYPEGKTDITGYTYEPWHIRYVGKKVAKYVTEKGITLDQYGGAVPYEEYFK